MTPITNNSSNTVYLNDQIEPSNWTRFWGGVNTLGGVGEILAGVGVAFGTSATGVGIGAGIAVAGHGVDTTAAGLTQLWSGKEERTFTSQGIAELTGSETTGEIADAGIGFFGSFGAAFAKVSKGFSSIAVPMPWKDKIWKYGKIDTLGSADEVGNITIQEGLKGTLFSQTLKHEMVHRYLSPKAETFQKLRAQLLSAGYSNSQILRFTEELLAESYAQQSIKLGYEFTKNPYYGITKRGLAVEGTVLGGVISNSQNLGQKLNTNE